MKIHDITT